MQPVNEQSLPRAMEVFGTFLRLGLTSFGGPVAHVGYFRNELVVRRGWLTEAQFAQLLAISQFLPGPASSQLGFALGLVRAGWPGALLAFVAFTLPSALALFAFALLLPGLPGDTVAVIIHGLKLVACVVVADALWGMARNLCPDISRRLLAALAMVVLLVIGGAVTQVAVVLTGAFAGVLCCRVAPSPGTDLIGTSISLRTAWWLLSLFACLLLGLLAWAPSAGGLVAVADGFYRSGALVFGGGHVVLPLLQEAVVAPGWVSEQQFLAGYGAAQAVPGPMFSLAAYLGALAPAGPAWLGASVALLAIFLPGFLLISAALPLWQRLQGHERARNAIAGVNATVVGILAAALVDPVLVSAIHGYADALIALTGLALMRLAGLSALWVVGWCVLAASMVAGFA